MRHSILIPHRGRLPYLRACLWSLGRSATATGITDFEVMLVHQEVKPSDTAEVVDMRRLAIGEVRIIVATPREPFNKPYMLNIGLGQARGDVLTFLDCDAIVGDRWLDGITEHFGTTNLAPPTRLCYRVRYLEAENAILPRVAMVNSFRRYTAGFDIDYLRAASRLYDNFPRAWEAYHNPLNNAPEGKEPVDPAPHEVFGNSQFSIRRDTLFELAEACPELPNVLGMDGRPLLALDEAFVGHGLNDLDYLCAIHHAAQRIPDGYRAAILTDGPHAMFHIRHPYEPDWRPEQVVDGVRLYPTREANSRRLKEKWSY